MCTVGDKICNYAYFNDDPDKQCNCDREGEQLAMYVVTWYVHNSITLYVGYLCGDCKDNKGVSSLLNRCVDCGDINIIFIAVLCKN